VAKAQPTDVSHEQQTLEDRLVAFAEHVGWFVGAAQAKTEGWFDRTTQLTDQLTRIRDEASELLRRLQPQKASSAQTASPRKAAPPQNDPSKAPGKKHRGPMASTRSVKHSDQRIARAKIATTRAGRRRG
jgi:hypothetical protein